MSLPSSLGHDTCSTGYHNDANPAGSAPIESDVLFVISLICRLPMVSPLEGIFREREPFISWGFVNSPG
jgi:hypothetical protein